MIGQTFSNPVKRAWSLKIGHNYSIECVIVLLLSIRGKFLAKRTFFFQRNDVLINVFIDTLIVAR